MISGPIPSPSKRAILYLGIPIPLRLGSRLK
jgi:hypothetical protein